MFDGGKIVGNEAAGFEMDQGGGGVSCIGATCRFIGATIENNVASIGSGVYQNKGTLTLKRSIIESNQCKFKAGNGGGVYCISRSSQQSNCNILDGTVIRGNGCAQFVENNHNRLYYYYTRSGYPEYMSESECRVALKWWKKSFST